MVMVCRPLTVTAAVLLTLPHKSRAHLSTRAKDIFEGAFDAPYDEIDANCDGSDDFDADADGWVPVNYAGIATHAVNGPASTKTVTVGTTLHLKLRYSMALRFSPPSRSTQAWRMSGGTMESIKIAMA